VPWEAEGAPPVRSENACQTANAANAQVFAERRRPALDELDGLRPMLRLPSLIIAALLLHAEASGRPALIIDVRALRNEHAVETSGHDQFGASLHDALRGLLVDIIHDLLHWVKRTTRRLRTRSGRRGWSIEPP
jgi:hypothetical protein